MEITNIILILVAGLNVGMALLIWLINPRHKTNIVFSLAVLSFGLWSLAEALFRISQTVQFAFIWARTENIFGSFIVLFFFFFTLYFPYQHIHLNNIHRLLLVISHFFLYIVLLSPFHVAGVILLPGDNDFILHPIGRTCYAFYFIVYLSIAFYWLSKKYFGSGGASRNNIATIIFATGFAAVFGTVFGVMLPLIFGRNNPWFVPLFSVPMIIILAWFIMRK